MARPAGEPIAPEVVAAAASGSPTKISGFVQRLTGWMSPGTPLPVSAPAGTQPRTLDFPIGFNFRTRPRQGERTSFEALRALADNCWQIALAVDTRKAQIKKCRWTIGFQDPDQQKAASKKKTADPRIAAITEFLRKPDREQTWRGWVAELANDCLVLDQYAIYPWRTELGTAAARTTPKPGGFTPLHSLDVYDAATITRKITDRGKTPEPPPPGVEPTDDHIAYQQIVRGVAAHNFTANELIYGCLNPRSNKLYGFSPVEMVEMVVNVAIRREMWRLDNYTAGSIPDALITAPESFKTNQIADLQLWWDSLYFGNQRAQHGARFIPGGPDLQVIFAKEKLLTDEIDEWIARVVCWAFSLPPTWAVKVMNRATAEQIQETALEEGQQPFMNDLEDVMDRCLDVGFGAPDLAFRFDDPRSVDPERKARVISTSGIFTFNEARAEFGKDPIEGGDDVILGRDGQPLYTEDLVTRPEPVVPVVDPNDPNGAPPKPGDTNEPPSGDGKNADDGDKENAGDGADEGAKRVLRAAEARLRCTARVPTSLARSHRSPAPSAGSSPAAAAAALASSASSEPSRVRSCRY